MQSDLSAQASEIALLKANEERMLRDSSDYREKAKSLEEELNKLKASRSVEDQPDEAEALSKLQKLLDRERILKQRAVNKLGSNSKH